MSTADLGILGNSMAAEELQSVATWPEWQWFETVESILEEVLSKVQESESTGTGMLYPFLDSVVESVDSLRMLVNGLKLRDSYVIARVIYETSLNACFLLTNPEALSSRASTHAKQKALRSLARAVEIAGNTIFEFEVQGAG